MITEKDLQEAIAECQGQRNPNANTCIKLAAYYTILDHLNDVEREEQGEPYPVYSLYSGGVDTTQTVSLKSGSEFSQVVDGLPTDDVWPVMDELMVTLTVTNPRLYDAVIRRLQERRA